MKKDPSPLTVKCPFTGCGAEIGAKCIRNGSESILVHPWRITAARKAAGYIRKPLPGEEKLQAFLNAVTGQKARK